MKIYEFVHQRNGRVTLNEIKAPKFEWKNCQGVFEDTYNHEVKVSEEN